MIDFSPTDGTTDLATGIRGIVGQACDRFAGLRGTARGRQA